VISRIDVTPQRAVNDCAAACLSMLLGVSYEKALLAIGDVLETGARTRDIKAAARKFGVRLRLKRPVDLETDSGLLAVGSKKWKTDHLVVLHENTIVDTDASIWYDIDEYLAVNEARALSVLVRTDAV
jgi:ABC-type bacteriocin/lantibiotic exporter with double-glycine peptidase domain